jgi:hypothetical protein
VGEITNSNPVGPIRLSKRMCVHMLVGCSLLRSSVLFLDYAHANEPVYLSTLFLWVRNYWLYEKRIVGDPTDCCDSFQLKDKVEDFLVK